MLTGTIVGIEGILCSERCPSSVECIAQWPTLCIRNHKRERESPKNHSDTPSLFKEVLSQKLQNVEDCRAGRSVKAMPLLQVIAQEIHGSRLKGNGLLVGSADLACLKKGKCVGVGNGVEGENQEGKEPKRGSDGSVLGVGMISARDHKKGLILLPLYLLIAKTVLHPWSFFTFQVTFTTTK